ncbi:MAG TPA: DUF4253 domain-containing protein [Polyangia bacterium]|jgi:hypothetical protein|nr:DUF4253 domain-containing protein [Polyangia bacterium]
MADLKDTLARAGIDVSHFSWFRSTPDPIARLKVGGSDAAVQWRILRALTAGTGHYPILVGNDEDLSRHNEAIESDPASTASIIEIVEASLDPIAWARERLSEQAEDTGDEDAYQHCLELLEEEPAAWPDDVEPTDAFTIPTNISTREPLARVNLLLLPTAVSWHAPAYLRFGAWNACPGAEDHAGLMRAWERQYGAEVVGISGDVVEMAVARPPTTRAEATRLAVVQYAYCNDIVDQGTQSVEALAAVLLDAPIWYFWWD